MKVSIIIAARNEAPNIIRCLEALHQLSYPKEHLQVLIGNDASTDTTAELISEYIKDKPHFKLYEIPPTTTKLRGKSNVLDYLFTKASGDIWLLTDADIAVPKNWVETYLKLFRTSNTGVIIGVTRMTRSNFWANLQSIEWLNTLGLIKLCELFTIPVTGMGNNMAITKKAYETTGGLQNIGFSIVEDYSLFQAIIQQNFGFKQAFEPEIIATSLPVTELQPLLKQRKRWMVGVFKSPIIIRSLLILSSVQIPLLVLLSFFNSSLALHISIGSYCLITSGVLGSIIYLKQYDLLKWTPLAWLYLNIMNLLMLANYFTPGKVVWKDRTY